MRMDRQLRERLRLPLPRHNLPGPPALASIDPRRGTLGHGSRQPAAAAQKSRHPPPGFADRGIRDFHGSFSIHLIHDYPKVRLGSGGAG